MSQGDTKQRILARRAKLVAAAMAGAGISACTPSTGPSEPATSSPPTVVSVEKPAEGDAGPTPPNPEGTAEPDGTAEPEPTPCLSIPADEPEPRPCLSIAPTSP